MTLKEVIETFYHWQYFEVVTSKYKDGYVHMLNITEEKDKYLQCEVSKIYSRYDDEFKDTSIVVRIITNETVK